MHPFDSLFFYPSYPEITVTKSNIPKTFTPEVTKNKSGVIVLGCQYIPNIKKIIYNDPATIVYWQDGSKTVVKCMEGQPFNEYYGFLCALGKKVYGSNANIQKTIGKYSINDKAVQHDR